MLEKLLMATTLTFALELALQLGTFSSDRTAAELNIPPTTTANISQILN